MITDAYAHRLAAIIESSHDAIVSKDLNGVICSWNRAAERIFGFTAAEAIGQRITLIIPPDRLSEGDDILARIRNGESVDHHETIRRHKDGTLIPIALTVWPIRDGDGTIIGASKVAQDIRDRRRAEAAFVEDLLDLSRIITGKFRLDVQPVSLSAAIDAAVEAVQPAATAKGIAVAVQTGSRADLVLGDSARLQQVVWNLLANAIKFTPRGGRVRVSVERHDSQVDVAVEDTGEGIDPVVLPYVFDRFRQGDGGTTRTHTGLGLGLAIVRHIVELHGGSVSATSPGRGEGSTFRISLPAVEADRPAEAARWPEHVAGSRRRTATGPPTKS